MRFLEELCFIVAGVNLGKFYPLIIVAAITFLVWGFNFLLLAFKPLRRINKSLLLITSLFCLSFLTGKIFCDVFANNPLDKFCVCTSVLLLPLIFLGLGVSFIFTPQKDTLNSSEKQLIDRLLSEEPLQKSLLADNAFSSNPFKRIERLSTTKGFDDPSFSDFNLNPSYVEGYARKLLEKDLSAEDRLIATKIFNAVQKYKLKNLSDYERDEFSTQLQKLIKLTAKYDKANIDYF